MGLGLLCAGSGGSPDYSPASEIYETVFVSQSDMRSPPAEYVDMDFPAAERSNRPVF